MTDNDSVATTTSSVTSAVVRITADVRERAAASDLDDRVTGIGAEPDVARLSRAINGMLDMADPFVREASAMMEHGAHDQFHRPVLLRGLKGGSSMTRRAPSPRPCPSR